MTTPDPDALPEDAFAAFVREHGLTGLADVKAGTEPDDWLHSEDDDGDGITLHYAERTASDGEVHGLVAIMTTGCVLLTADAMDQLAAWLTARSARAREVDAV